MLRRNCPKYLDIILVATGPTCKASLSPIKQLPKAPKLFKFLVRHNLPINQTSIYNWHRILNIKNFRYWLKYVYFDYMPSISYSESCLHKAATIKIVNLCFTDIHSASACN